MEATRVAISSEFKALSKSDTILKGRKPEEVAAFSNMIFVHEISVFCPVWHACMKGACGITKAKSQNDKLTKSTNVMALATASLGRFRNEQLSVYAYRLSTILFHSGVKHNDILRLNRLGVCMSPQSVVNFRSVKPPTHPFRLEVLLLQLLALVSIEIRCSKPSSNLPKPSIIHLLARRFVLYHTGHTVRGIKLLQFSRDLLSKISQSEICVRRRTQK